MAAQHPTEGVQRKAALFEAPKAPEGLGTASGALPLASGSITLALPAVLGAHHPEAVGDASPSPPAPIAGLSPGTQWHLGDRGGWLQGTDPAAGLMFPHPKGAC